GAMHADRFDALTLAVAEPGSRRALARAAFAGTVAAGLLASTRRHAAAGSATDAFAKCAADADCETGYCRVSGRCKKHGKLTGKCRCGCSGAGCPDPLVCCDAAEGLVYCALPLGETGCKTDVDCCFGACRDGVCCRAKGGSCGGVDALCCSGSCTAGFCD
ncbi:MAG TPA: hypothetical protein VFI22_05715, partial [Thermomicrobiales bacterium]|nr:hypothetical protein [Thermomicrobiales bacterium]